MVSQTSRTRENVYGVLETIDRAFGGGDKIHRSKCPWWRKRVAKSCDCGRILIYATHNTITNEGDQYYAENAAQGITGVPTTTTRTFNDMTVATAVATPVDTKTADADDITTVPTGGTQDIDTSPLYPMVSDSDANNPGTTGPDILTWRTSYTASQANGTLVAVCIHESGATLGAASGEPLLMAANFSSSIAKTASQNLTMYVNHQFDGVVTP